MPKIEVTVDGAPAAEKIDDLAADVPAFAGRLREQLAAAGDTLNLGCWELSERNSKSFQVIGMLYRVVREYQNEHGSPDVVIHCDIEKTARMYRQVYNFYIPKTKAERMEDPDWD